MIGYVFLPEKNASIVKPVYPDILVALDWAKGPYLHRVKVANETIREDSIVSDSMRVLGCVNSTDILRHFARRCAFRTFGAVHRNEATPLRGLWYWLHDNVRPKTWNELLVWAKSTEMLWMNGGHAEAAICNALLSHCEDREVWHHSWLTGAHAKMLYGKAREIPIQKKSLTQLVNKQLFAV